MCSSGIFIGYSPPSNHLDPYTLLLAESHNLHNMLMEVYARGFHFAGQDTKRGTLKQTQLSSVTDID